MDKYIKKFAKNFIDIEEIKEYQFQTLCGFTFAFKNEILFINEQIASCEIKPIAIIYEENGEYYMAHIDVVDEIEEVVKEFVKTQLQ